MVKRRAALLRVWRLTPDREVRAAIETELYGQDDPQRAAAEAELLSDLGAENGEASTAGTGELLPEEPGAGGGPLAMQINGAPSPGLRGMQLH